MFKHFVNELIAAHTADEVRDIFYRADGIDRAFQNDKLSYKDYSTLLALVNKLIIWRNLPARGCSIGGGCGPDTEHVDNNNI